MSRNEWENGTLLLPSVAVAPLKKTLRDWTNSLHEEVRAEAVRIHKDIAKSTRSMSLYRERITAHERARWTQQADRDRRGHYSFSAASVTSEDRKRLVHGLALAVVRSMLWSAERAGTAPRQPKVEDVNRIVPKKINRDNHFDVFSPDGFAAATISFSGREVTWDVDENNHAVEQAHESPLGVIFFAALGKIAWSRGTGGALIGNDEYNRESYESGGGGNYTTLVFGPRGDEHRIDEYVRNGFSRKAATDMVKSATSTRGRARVGSGTSTW